MYKYRLSIVYFINSSSLLRADGVFRNRALEHGRVRWYNLHGSSSFVLWPESIIDGLPFSLPTFVKRYPSPPGLAIKTSFMA